MRRWLLSPGVRRSDSFCLVPWTVGICRRSRTQQPRNAPLHNSRLSATFSANRLSSPGLAAKRLQTGARCMRRSLPFSLSVQAFLLAACAGSVPAEPWQKFSLRPPSKATVSKELQQTPCPRLASAIAVYVERIKALEAKAKSEQAAPPPHLWSALQRSFGEKGSGIAALEQLAKERVAADAANRALEAKGCRTIDVDAALKSPAPSQQPKK